MKQLAMAMSLAVTSVFVGAIAHAENPEHMRQLLSTGDCPGCDLSGATLTKLDLTGANLEGANLEGVRFSDVQLVRANLEEADLSKTSFRGSDLTGANLENADLSGMSSFFVCNGLDIYSYGEEVSQSEVDNCVSQLVTFRLSTELCQEDSQVFDLIADTLTEDLDDFCGSGGYSEALIYFPQYSRLYLPGLLLRGANLKGADLSDADLSGVDLSYAVLSNADASTATFDYATLLEADLSGLEAADLDSAWKSPLEMAEWFVSRQLAAEEQARQEVSRIYVGSMNRGQQAYYLEHNEFATDLSLLGLGSPSVSEYDLFDFGLLPDDRDDVTVQYVLSKDGDLPSSMGVAYLAELDQDSASSADKEFVTMAAICESDMAISILPDELPDIAVVDEVVSCPAGWTMVR